MNLWSRLWRARNRRAARTRLVVLSAFLLVVPTSALIAANRWAAARTEGAQPHDAVVTPAMASERNQAGS